METVVVGVLSLIGTMIGTIGGILSTNKMVNFRLDEIERKIDELPNLSERIAISENDIKNIYHRLGGKNNGSI